MRKGVLEILPDNNVAFLCPGCHEDHVVHISSGPRAAGRPQWAFNDDYDKPTFSPSYLLRTGHYVPGAKPGACWCTWDAEHPDDPSGFKCGICHSFVRNGEIQFLNDCTHALAGKTVRLEAFKCEET